MPRRSGINAPMATLKGSLLPNTGAVTFSAGAAVQPRTVSSHRLDYIDALRGIAALWVVAFHTVHLYSAQQSSPNPVTQAFVSVAEYGHLGVNLFLVLSGFCLFYPIARKYPAQAPVTPTFRSFMKRRARRILPPYYALLTLLAVGYFVAARLQRSVPARTEESPRDRRRSALERRFSQVIPGCSLAFLLLLHWHGQNMPARAFYQECLRHGDSFLWMPQLFCGFYVRGEGQGGFCHPEHWLLYRFLPVSIAITLESLMRRCSARCRSPSAAST